jgi:hypothetical protein
MDIEIEEIGPKLAEKYLESNPLNRSVSTRVVNSYAADMKAGNWKLTGDPIRFDHNGNLLDGQHRLHAIIAADVPVQSVVIRNLDPADRAVVDSGRKRTGANVLEMAGIKGNSMVLSATAAIGCFDDKGKLVSSVSRIEQPTHSELLKWAQENFDDISTPFRPAMRIYQQHRGSCAGYVYGAYKIYEADPHRAYNFLQDVAEMATGGRGDPKAALLRRLQVLGSTQRVRAKAARTIYAFYTAWNAYQLGQDLYVISDPDKGVTMPTPIKSADRKKIAAEEEARKAQEELELELELEQAGK